MSNIKNAFTILYLLSSSDGEVSSSEIDLIMKFIKENSDELDFDHRRETRELLFLSKDEIKLHLEKAAIEYKNDTTPEQRELLLKFALDLVMADGRIDPEEIRMFNILGKVWEINVDEFINANYKY